jgi:hypothetical protein
MILPLQPLLIKATVATQSNTNMEPQVDMVPGVILIVLLTAWVLVHFTVGLYFDARARLQTKGCSPDMGDAGRILFGECPSQRAFVSLIKVSELICVL